MKLKVTCTSVRRVIGWPTSPSRPSRRSTAGDLIRLPPAASPLAPLARCTPPSLAPQPGVSPNRISAVALRPRTRVRRAKRLSAGGLARRGPAFAPAARANSAAQAGSHARRRGSARPCNAGGRLWRYADHCCPRSLSAMRGGSASAGCGSSAPSRVLPRPGPVRAYVRRTPASTSDDGPLAPRERGREGRTWRASVAHWVSCLADL